MKSSISNILIVDDEQKICEILSEILEGEGYKTHTAYNGADALDNIRKYDIDLMLLDIKLPDMDGITVLKKIKKINPVVSVVMISAFGTVALAVEALKSGADDFIEKPLETNRVLTTISNVLEKVELKKQSSVLKSEILDKYKILGASSQIRKVLELIDKIASSTALVLIRGESGVGKELVARNLYFKSGRAAKPFIKVNCAALPGELVESELFGYEKGAFTGAYTRKPGQFELASNGTLFLDEVGDMSLQAQSKVLSAIEDNAIQRLGGTKPIKVDVRIITATNKDLQHLISKGHFREDLFHRINVLSINVPPLRQRKDDITLMIDYFLKNACIDNNRPLKTLSKKAIQFLKHQDWPGNVRELKHLMEKAAILIEDAIIDIDDIEAIIGKEERGLTGVDRIEIDDAKKRFEKEYILSILNETGWHITEAAKMLGIDRSTLFRKMKKLGIRK
jgi:two-component system nitrogen regulation response regulator NtrX